MYKNITIHVYFQVIIIHKLFLRFLCTTANQSAVLCPLQKLEKILYLYFIDSLLV